MSDLVEFLRARLDEDEAVARAASGGTLDVQGWSFVCPDDPSGDTFRWSDRPHAVETPARVLREVEAKRRIVDEHPVAVWIQPESTLKNPHTGRPWTEGGTHLGGCKVCDADDSTATYPCDTIRALAAVYSDHPDYRDEWR